MDETVFSAEDVELVDAAVTRLLAGEPVGAVPARLEPFVEAAVRARAALAIEVPDHVAERHLAAMRDAGSTVRPLRSDRGGHRRRVAVIGLAAAISLSVMGSAAVAASSTALPGEVLYPVKRAAESVTLALHRDHADRAQLHLDFAQRRLIEVQELLAARRSGENVDVGAAMSAYQRQLALVEDGVVRSMGLGAKLDTLLAHLEEQLGKHVEQLTDLRDNRVPEQARDAIQRAIDNAEKAKANVGRGRGGGKPDTVGNSGKAPGRAPARSSR